MEDPCEPQHEQERDSLVQNPMDDSSLNCVRFLPMLLAGALLSSCASAPAADLAAVRVFNVHQNGGEAVPQEVEGCEALGSVSASAPSPEAGSSVAFVDPKGLIETIRARALRKGADTVFVSLEPGSLQGGRSTLRATVFRCGDSTVPQTLGSPVR